MATEIPTPREPGMATLVTGIVDDLQVLVKQQLDLFRSEVKSDLHKTKEAALPLVLGLVGLLLGAGLLLFMLVYLVYASTTWPLWGCFALIGAGLVVLSAAL